MVFRIASAAVTLLIYLAMSGGKASAQYYPPAQVYPPSQGYPRGYHPRQPLPPIDDDDYDTYDDMVYDLPDRPLRDALEPQANGPPRGGRYGASGAYRDRRQPGYRDLPPPLDEDFAGTRPYYGMPGAILPGTADPAEQDAIRQEAMRSRLPISPGQIGPGSVDPRVTPPNMAAFPPDVRPEIGPKKELAPQFRRTLIDYRTKEPAGTIIVDTPNTYLYLVLGEGKALRYGVGVGRQGFTWSGAERVTKMAEWPDWNPPPEMIVRQPYLPRFMAGGETNPLGARALYLGDTAYRIHGTNQPSTIGTFVSSGCVRLTNEDIMDLYRRVRVGTRVVVLPGRPPARDATVPLAPRPGASMLPSGGSAVTAPLGTPPSTIAR
jgi:lipoprotein-anchoring transpeptidase ErfK/SrfK